ncbi:hypothetical protein GOV13_03475 [Candidatus Pacearchaeota archaeon]|nr:hypothetical protein [Candidatus Pacearchaeota archaeon]
MNYKKIGKKGQGVGQYPVLIRIIIITLVVTFISVIIWQIMLKMTN